MSWVRRITLICDSCFTLITPPLTDPQRNSIHAQRSTFGWSKRRVGEDTFDLCSVCAEAARALPSEEVERRLLEGVSVDASPQKSKRQILEQWFESELVEFDRDLDEVLEV